MERLKLNQGIIEYTLERKKIKNCYISIKDGKISVRVPKRMSQESIEKVLMKRADWILENVREQRQKVQMPKQYINGEIFSVLGRKARLQISYEKLKEPKLKWKLNQINVRLPVGFEGQEKEEVKKLMDKFYQELAEKEVEKAMRKMSMKVGIAPNQYKIKNLKSSWGNCSVTGNISINRKVVMYSRQTIEYVCLHEICHLQNMNHSQDFWNMVATYMPDYKMAEQELKT